MTTILALYLVAGIAFVVALLARAGGFATVDFNAGGPARAVAVCLIAALIWPALIAILIGRHL